MGIEPPARRRFRTRRVIVRNRFEHRHSPDGIARPVSAFAGRTIGIRRMFFFGRPLIIGFQKTQILVLDFTYKANYKYLSVSKERCAGSCPPAFENFGTHDGSLATHTTAVLLDSE